MLRIWTCSASQIKSKCQNKCLCFCFHQTLMSVQKQVLKTSQVHSALKSASTPLVHTTAPATVVTNFIWTSTRVCVSIRTMYKNLFVCSSLALMLLVSAKLFGLPCLVSCGGCIFDKHEGLLSSPRYPRPSPPLLSCKYIISVQPGFTVTLNFTGNFHIDSVDAQQGPTCSTHWLQVTERGSAETTTFLERMICYFYFTLTFCCAPFYRWPSQAESPQSFVVQRVQV